MKTFTILKISIVCLFAFMNSVYAQTDSVPTKPEPLDEPPVTVEDEEIFERPFNFFASAGVSYRFGDFYNISISPVDYTLQFEKISPLSSGVSLGLVWNPFPNTEVGEKLIQLKNQGLNNAVKAARRHAAVALLVNVFSLSYTSNQVQTASPIDVGFGLGYRNENFMVLGTVEFTGLNQPRKYIMDNYKDKNSPLILFGSEEPVRTISTDDNSLFIKKLYPAIGIKVAYAFTKAKKDATSLLTK